MDDPAKIVEEYLRLHMIPDPATARKLYCAPEMEIRFTGNRLMHDPAEATAFEGNRYVDRYVVRRGKIVQMEVWNDRAEWLLVRAGLVKP